VLLVLIFSVNWRNVIIRFLKYRDSSRSIHIYLWHIKKRRFVSRIDSTLKVVKSFDKACLSLLQVYKIFMTLGFWLPILWWYLEEFVEVLYEISSIVFIIVKIESFLLNFFLLDESIFQNSLLWSYNKDIFWLSRNSSNQRVWLTSFLVPIKTFAIPFFKFFFKILHSNHFPLRFESHIFYWEKLALIWNKVHYRLVCKNLSRNHQALLLLYDPIRNQDCIYSRVHRSLVDTPF